MGHIGFSAFKAEEMELTANSIALRCRIKQGRVLLPHYLRPVPACSVAEFTPIAGDIYEAMLHPKRSVTECASAALAKHASTAGPVFVESFGTLLGDLMERGVLLGSVARRGG